MNKDNILLYGLIGIGAVFASLMFFNEENEEKPKKKVVKIKKEGETKPEHNEEPKELITEK